MRITEKAIAQAQQELRDYIGINTELAIALINKAPKSFTIKTIDGAYDEAWKNGFGRCLAELKRIAEKEK